MRKRIKDYFENYRFNSLFFKNLYMLLLLIMVPIVGAIGLGYFVYQNMQKNEIEKYGETICSDITAQMKGIIQEAEVELMYFGMNTNVELYLYDKDLTQYNYKVNSIRELIHMPMIIKDYVEGVYIYSMYSGYVISPMGVAAYETWEGRGILDDYVNQEKEERKHINITEWEGDSSTKRYFTVFCDIDYGRDKKGVAVMNMRIPELLEELQIPEGTRICIADGDKILLASDDTLLEQGVSSIEWYHDGTSIDSGKKYYSLARTDGESGLTVYVQADMSNYQDRLSHVRFLIVLMIIVIVWLTLILSFFISVRLFQPIEKIVESVKQYNSILTDKQDIFLGKDELEYILKSIQKSVSAKKNIETELMERIHLLKKAQAVALQSQINPHFMNNALETINWSASGLLGSRNEISEMAGALSQMLRMSLQSTDTIVPIQTEMQHCKYYLEIQEKRYEDKFQVVWDIEPEVYECRIIRIVLQPLVENAIYHGVKPLSNKGTITISGKLIDDFVELSVTDNGLGMSSQDLENLRQVLRERDIRENYHIGVANVNQRLKLYFGEEYGLKIESREGFGTKVTIHIPKN